MDRLARVIELTWKNRLIWWKWELHKLASCRRWYVLWLMIFIDTIELITSDWCDTGVGRSGYLTIPWAAYNNIGQKKVSPVIPLRQTIFLFYFCTFLKHNFQHYKHSKRKLRKLPCCSRTRKGNESSNPRTQKRSGQITSALEREERMEKGLSSKADAWLTQVRRCMVGSG